MNTDKIYAEHIANEYSEKTTSKVKQLKKLDAMAKNPAIIFSLIFGIVSSLVFGTGMCLAMSIIGGGSAFMIAAGIIIGCLGIAGMCVNYFIYRRILENSKNKYKHDILTLVRQITDEED